MCEPVSGVSEPMCLQAGALISFSVRSRVSKQNVCAHVFDLPYRARQGYGYYDHKESPRSDFLGNGYCVLRLSPISPEPSHPPQSPADTGPPPLNFIVDYLAESGQEEQLSCIK